jgi:hypothetical protein
MAGATETTLAEAMLADVCAVVRLARARFGYYLVILKPASTCGDVQARMEHGCVGAGARVALH